MIDATEMIQSNLLFSGHLALSPGKYYCNLDMGPLSVETSQMTLSGAGPARTILYPYDPLKPVIKVQSTNWLIKDLSVFGDEIEDHNNNASYGIYFVNMANHCAIKQVDVRHFRGFPGIGIYNEDKASALIIEDCAVTQCNVGIRLQQHVMLGSIYRSRIHNNLTSQIILDHIEPPFSIRDTQIERGPRAIGPQTDLVISGGPVILDAIYNECGGDKKSLFMSLADNSRAVLKGAYVKVGYAPIPDHIIELAGINSRLSIELSNITVCGEEIFKGRQPLEIKNSFLAQKYNHEQIESLWVEWQYFGEVQFPGFALLPDGETKPNVGRGTTFRFANSQHTVVERFKGIGSGPESEPMSGGKIIHLLFDGMTELRTNDWIELKSGIQEMPPDGSIRSFIWDAGISREL